MRYKILLFTAFSFIICSLEAQRASKIFAITGDNGGNNPFLWTNISEVDAKTGQVIRPLYTHYKTPFDLYDGVTKTKRFGSSAEANQRQAAPQMPVSFLVAAAAYDVRHNRMFLAPMQQPELRWINLDDKDATVKIYTVPLPLKAEDLVKEAAQITRMVIAADGYGYALTNDANHLIRFSTGNNTDVADLGALQDDARNGAISVHVKNTSFGGDMIADAAGNLYLVSAYHAIFKIDLTSRTAAYTGSIKNLPADYTTNGAAINEDGDLIVSSAVPTAAGGYYKVDMNTWEAVKLTGETKTPSVSDLASGYLAFQKKQPSIAAVFVGNISVYPNPVTAAAFKVSFVNKEIGLYTIQLIDAAGRLTLQQRISLISVNQLATLKMPPGIGKGIYTVKVLKADGKLVYTKGVLVN